MALFCLINTPDPIYTLTVFCNSGRCGFLRQPSCMMCCPGDVQMIKRDWVLRRNCSISPRQLAAVYALISLTSLFVAIFVSLRGAWYVLGFALLEQAALGWAFLVYARHARDREQIMLAGHRLRIELIRAERIWQYCLDARRTWVDLSALHRGVIGLEEAGARVEVGRYLMYSKRREFARELQSALESSKKEF